MARKPRWWSGMNKVREILRLYEHGEHQTAISAACGVSRQTVRNYIRRAEVANIGSKNLQNMSEQEALTALGMKPGGRPSRAPEPDHQHIHEQRQKHGSKLPLLTLWQEYLIEHPDGCSYPHFCSQHRKWLRQKAVVMRRVHTPGEEIQVDWAGDTIDWIDPHTEEVQQASLFIAVFPASAYGYVEATVDQKKQSWLGAHTRAFEFFTGVSRYITPDNLKAGVTSACLYDPELNPSYRDLAEHYNLIVVPTRVKKPRDKGAVENFVRQVQTQILAPLRNHTFTSVEEINAAIAPLLQKLLNRKMKAYNKSRAERFLELDKPALQPLPEQRYLYASWHHQTVPPDYHIKINGTAYSVPHTHVGEPLAIRVSESSVECFYQNKRLCLHKRTDEAGASVSLLEHMPESHRYMKELSSEHFLTWSSTRGEYTGKFFWNVLGSGKPEAYCFKQLRGIQALEKKYGSERLECACKQAHRWREYRYSFVENLLEQQLEEVEQTSIPRTLHHQNIRGGKQFT